MLLKGAESAQVLTKPRPIDNNWPSLCSFCCCGHVPSRLSPGLIVLKTAEWLQTRKMAPLASTGSALRDSAEKGSLQLLEDSIADEHVLLGGGMHLYGSIGLLSLVKLLRIGSGCSRPKKIHKAIAMARGTTVGLVGPQSTRRGLASCGVAGHQHWRCPREMANPCITDRLSSARILGVAQLLPTNFQLACNAGPDKYQSVICQASPHRGTCGCQR